MVEIKHPDPGSGMKNFLGLKYLNSLMRIQDPGWKKVGSGIRDKHPGSATLVRLFSFFFFSKLPVDCNFNTWIRIQILIQQFK
jgi:hypothetical protein